jgi:hypothetical protein
MADLAARADDDVLSDDREAPDPGASPMLALSWI